MFCIPSFDEMTNLTPYFNHVIPAYAGIQTVSHSASQVEELYETGSSPRLFAVEAAHRCPKGRSASKPPLSVRFCMPYLYRGRFLL